MSHEVNVRGGYLSNLKTFYFSLVEIVLHLTIQNRYLVKFFTRTYLCMLS